MEVDQSVAFHGTCLSCFHYPKSKWSFSNQRYAMLLFIR